MAKRGKPLEAKIEFITGVPGGGKSLLMVERTLRVLQLHKRPVYTNMPLRWRVFRRYLRNRGGEELAGLLHELTEPHFVNFMRRYVALSEFRKDLRQRGIYVNKAEQARLFCQEHGEHVTSTAFGVDGEVIEHANWIPAGSVIVIDEVQHWFPNPQLKRVGAAKEEPKELLSYLTMHRHLMHWIWFATQADRQVSTTIRSLAHLIVRCHPKDDDKLAWGIRFKHFGIKALGYEWYTPEQIDSNMPPSKSACIIPSLPCRKYVYRLYESYTHAGSRAELERQMKQAQEADGVVPDSTSSEGRKRRRKPARRGFVSRVVRFFGRWMLRASVALVVFSMGTCVGKRGVDESAGEVKAVAPVFDRTIAITSVGRDYVRFEDGRQVGIGGSYEGLELLYVAPRRRASVWHDVTAADIWVWRVGRGAQRVGNAERIVRAFESGELPIVRADDAD